MRSERWAVYSREHELWLADTCAGGSWTPAEELVVEYSSEAEAWEAIDAAEIEREQLEVIQLAGPPAIL